MKGYKFIDWVVFLLVVGVCATLFIVLFSLVFIVAIQYGSTILTQIL